MLREIWRRLVKSLQWVWRRVVGRNARRRRPYRSVPVETLPSEIATPPTPTAPTSVPESLPPETQTSPSPANLGDLSELEKFDRLMKELSAKPGTGTSSSPLPTSFEPVRATPPPNSSATSPPDWFERGYTLAMQGRVEEAIASYERALEVKPDDHQTWSNRGVALEKLGRNEEAIASYERALEVKPDYHEAWFNRGVALANLGRYEEAIASWERALEVKPDDHEAWYSRGVALEKLGRNEEAIASYERALEVKPDDHQAWYNRGLALLNLGRYEEAIASWERALEVKPDKHEAWYNRGNALAELGRYEEAIASYERALEVKPDLHEAWYNRGLALANLGRNEEAIASYERALEVKPDQHEAWSNRGVALANLGRYEEAIASWERALEVKPDYHPAWSNRGSALDDLGRYEEAIASWERALEVKPDDHDAWYSRGLALANLGRNEEAIASYERALEVKPDYHQAWVNRGGVLDNLGRYEEAIASYDHALAIKPDLHQAWINRGLAAGQSQFNPLRPEMRPVLTPTTRVEEFCASRKENTERLIASFAHLDTPQLLAFLRQPIPDRLLLFLQQSPNPAQLEAFFARTDPLLPPQQNPELNQRGYEGELICYREGLKHVPETSQGAGQLHYYIGLAHYDEGKRQLDVLARDPRPFWLQSLASYEQSLEILTEDAFPQLRLETLTGLIRTLLALRESDRALDAQREGTNLIRQLLNQEPTTAGKRRLEAQFSHFSLRAIDVWLQAGDPVTAWETAERFKNRTLTWILEAQGEQTISPSYRDALSLLTPNASAVYWHLSPDALTTFVLTPNADAPQVVDTRDRLSELQTWIRQWQRDYADVRKPKTDPSSWRERLCDRLETLKTLLGIPEIEAALPNSTSDLLVLVPHRELHLFPLHALFENRPNLVYLPSLQLGLTARARPPKSDRSLLSIEHPTHEDLPDLPHAQIESALIRHIFRNCTRISYRDATRERVLEAIAQPHAYLHFNGHAEYRGDRPEQSALFLSGQATLTLSDIVNCDRNTAPYRLIALAACETALTANQSIDTEYVGLTSAFLRHGAAQVLSTLWPVESAASALLMVEFYRRLEDRPAAIALWEACDWLRNATASQLATQCQQLAASLPDNESAVRMGLQTESDRFCRMEASDRPYENPYFWAGFTLSGLPPESH